jgi:hypothetical protein
MKNIYLFAISITLFSKTANGQAFLKNSLKSVYVLYGRHFITNYVVDSGSTNLAGAKMYITWEAGLNLDYKLSKNWKIRTGIAFHIHFVDEVFYGVTAVPDTILKLGELKPKTKIPAQALLDPLFIERKSIGIPIKPMYQINVSKNSELNIAGGLYLNFYFPTRNENIGQSVPIQNSSAPYEYTEVFDIKRKFNNRKILEWQFDIEVVRKFKKYGAIVGGIKTHIGTRKLERAEFITWSKFSDYRSKGHYTINRSYIGIHAGYRFGKNN